MIRYTFFLKSRTFFDGIAITAKNVEMSLKRIFVSGASLSSDLSFIKGKSIEIYFNPVDAKIVKKE